MRHTELSEGISVLDDKGNVVGTSKLAARHVSVDSFACIRWKVKDFCSDKCLFVQALMETSLTRVVMPMPILLLPPLIMAILERSEKFLWIWHFRFELFLQHHHLENHTSIWTICPGIFLFHSLMWTLMYVFKGVVYTQIKCKITQTKKGDVWMSSYIQSLLKP